MYERKNKIILNKVKYIYWKKKCHKELWGDVVDCAKYLLNRFTTKYRYSIISKEAWGLHKPNIDHLRVFGNVVYAKIQEEKRTKLGKKSY